MDILFNEVERRDLRAGDHIYSWRTGYTYAHHGIFVGDDDVVHFTRGSGQELGAGVSSINSFVSSSIPKQHPSCTNPTGNCGFQNGNNGVIRSCLNCFLDGGAVHRFEYGVRKAVFFAQVRGGTCTLAQSDPADEVIYRAMYLHKHGFGNYDLFSKNCEDFAIYCRTGYIVEKGSGQVAAMDGVYSALRFAYNHLDMFNISAGKAVMLVGSVVTNYSLKRYAADIGVRVDKAKVPVEDLATFPDSSTGIRVDKSKVPIENSAVNLESTGIRVDKVKAPVASSTGKKPPAEDLAVYFDSSTGISIDKTKVPVEGEPLFLDSSTVKKPSANESSTSQEISRKRSSKKQKKKLRQQQRRNFELMQEVEDVPQFPDSSTDKKPPAQSVTVSLASSTDKKPPVAESSTSRATRRNRSSRKQKKKLRQQQKGTVNE